MLKSTRSNNSINPSKAILKGLSEDGGLFVFDAFNQTFFNEGFLTKTYQELCFYVFKEFLTDYSNNQIKDVIDKSYNNHKFKGNVVDIVSFKNYSYLTLFNGNTFAFKDVALSCLPNLMETAKVINEINKKTVILTATSGDTGSATLEGFNHLKDVFVVVLYPTEGVSEFQELQMQAYKSPKNFLIPVIGNFDDCQRIVKEIFMSLKPKHITLSSANSINIGRIIPQTVYYFHSYLELVRTNQITFGEKINVTVPTGNFGNIYSAYIAKKMGVPMNKLIVASNQNNVLTDVFNQSIYKTSRALKKTISPSMDILVSSNLERYLYDLLKHDSSRLAYDMEKLKLTNKIQINELSDNQIFRAYYASEAETKQTIKNTFEQTNYLIDPHTAVAKTVADKYQKDTLDTTYMLVVSTANPYKFSDAVMDALNIDNEGTLESKFKAIESYTTLSIDSRMKSVLNTEINKTSYQIDEVYKSIEKIVGDLDVEN